jgi:hypothetical protein
MGKGLLRILLVVPCAACIAQDVRVVDNPIEGSKSVRIAISAQESYKRADGSEFTPRVEIRCEATKSGRRWVEAILETGGVWLKTYNRPTLLWGTETRGEGPSMLETRFDEEKPTKDVWLMFPDGDHLRFVTAGLVRGSKTFVKKALKARTVYIAFPPRGSRLTDVVVSRFDLTGFDAEFEKHPECTVK